MRIRTIKPEFWLNEELSALSPDAALLAIGLLNYADDEGYFNANPMLIKAAIFPIRETKDIQKVLLPELIKCGYIELYCCESGKIYGHVVNFAEHQVINKPKPSKIIELVLLPYSYGTGVVAVTSGKERKGKEGNGSARNNFEIKKPEDVSQTVWDDFTLLRKNKKAPITETALKAIRTEAQKAGWTIDRALAECCARGWQGFNAEWVKGEAITAKPEATPDGERKTYEWHKELLRKRQFNHMPEYRLIEKIAEYEAKHGK